MFGVPECCETRYLFDEGGKLLHRGYYFQDGMANRLRGFVDGGRSYSPSLLLDSVRSVRGGQFERVLAASSRSRTGKAVIMLLSSVSTTCPSGELAALVSEFSRENAEVECLALLPNTFSPSDVDNLKTNLDIPFQVETADDDLSRKWLALLEEYGETSVNGTIITVDGERVSVAHGMDEAKAQLNELRGGN